MCFGIRISSPFDLNTLNIPIQNIKCPKNTKNACADIILSPAIICEAWTVLSLHKHAKPNLCDRQCYPWITLFGAMLCAGICDQGWKWLQSFVISSSKHEMCSHVFQGPWWPTVLGPFAMKNWVPIWSLFQGSAAVIEKETQVPK